MSEQFPKTLLDLLNKESHVAVLTGAGISAESGLPTFRGAGGWWRQYRAEDLATPQAFARDPKLVWQWYNHRREQIKNHHPNPGHVALAQLQNFVGTSALVYPAAQLPQRARAAGAYLVEINLQETPLTPLAQLFISQAAGEVLPGLIHALQKVS